MDSEEFYFCMFTLEKGIYFWHTHNDLKPPVCGMQICSFIWTNTKTKIKQWGALKGDVEKKSNFFKK